MTVLKVSDSFETRSAKEELHKFIISEVLSLAFKSSQTNAFSKKEIDRQVVIERKTFSTNNSFEQQGTILTHVFHNYISDKTSWM